MKSRIPLFFLALAAATATPAVVQAQSNIVWDTSTAAGFQNGNGIWGTDNFWTTTGGGTTLTGWTAGNNAWLGGNGTVAATPGGDFTITVSGTQTASTIRQIQNGDGNFTLTGGALDAAGFRVDRGIMTVNSTVVTRGDGTPTISYSVIVGTDTLIIGGNNTFTNELLISGNVGGGGKILMNHPNALGLGTLVRFTNGANLDLNGYSISGKDIRVNNSRTGVLVNSNAAAVEWSGNVILDNTTSVGFRAGGTGGEVNVSGVISGLVANTVQSLDNGTLRLSGNNTYEALTSLRAGSTLIVGHENALGSPTSGTFIGATATLDLNGFDIGNEAVTFQQASSRLVNANISAAANASGNIEFQNSGYLDREIGGAGNLTLGGVISGNNAGAGFTKVGSGTLTLGGTNTYTGQTAVDGGSLLVNGNQSAAVGAVTVASGATLGGTGTLGGATDISGILAPGDGGIGTLTVANNVTWNGGQSWLFDLGAAGASIGTPGTSDLLSISGGNDFLKGTGSTWTFDFAGSGDLGWYKLADWAGGTSDFSAGDFTATNLGGGNTGEFTIQNDGLYFQVVPEPSTVALLGAFAAGAWGLRYRRRAA